MSLYFTIIFLGRMGGSLVMAALLLTEPKIQIAFKNCIEIFINLLFFIYYNIILLTVLI